MTNLADDALSLLAGATPQGVAWGWATVTQASPLRVRLDGTTAAQDVTPVALVGGLRVGDRVWTQVAGRRLVVYGTPLPAGPWTARTETYGSLSPTLGFGAGPCAVVIRAPATGMVKISFSGDLRQSASSQDVVLAFRVREGSTPGSGTIVDAGDDAGFPASSYGRTFTRGGSGAVSQQGTGPHLVTGLTPGDEYVVELVGRSNPGGGTIQRPSLMVEPVV